jgi:hypothetical protein
MIEAGILTSADKVELLENYIILKMPRTPLHNGTIDLVMATLQTLRAHPHRYPAVLQAEG